MNIQSINPATGGINKEFEAISGAVALKEARAVAKDCRKAFRKWRRAKIKERQNLLRNLGDVLRKNKAAYAQLITIEMGKPIAQSGDEISKCAELCDYYADNLPVFLKEEFVATDAAKSYIAFEPLGVILAIMPWNYPFWQALRCAIPAMAAGNAVVLRHSNIVPQCALAIEHAFAEAGFPENTFRSIITDHDTVYALVRSRHISMVSFTGSPESGSIIAKVAGKYLKKCVMELGGSDAFVIMKDADIRKAAEAGARGRLKNTGQACNCPKRFIVVAERQEEFERIFIEEMKKYSVGDPMSASTQVGPLVREEQRQKLETQVSDALAKGARLLIGGHRIEGNGFFYEPTVISGVKKGMLAFKEEVFGPVALIIIATSDMNAISLANKTDYGLGASIWTADIRRGEKLARRIEAGTIYVNGKVRSDFRMPFGGVKRSGYGRELSRYGILEFVNIKSVKIFGEPAQARPTPAKSQKKESPEKSPVQPAKQPVQTVQELEAELEAR